MCRRGGSKGGKHPDDVTDINVGNTATQNPGAWRTVTARIRRKATQWNKHPLGLFLLPKWGRFGSQRKSRGNDYPCGKIKIL